MVMMWTRERQHIIETRNTGEHGQDMRTVIHGRYERLGCTIDAACNEVGAFGG